MVEEDKDEVEVDEDEEEEEEGEEELFSGASLLALSNTSLIQDLSHLA